MKNKFWVLLLFWIFLFDISAAFCFEEPIPKTIHETSSNNQYLLEILPLFTTSEIVPESLERNELIVIVYEMKKKEFKDVDEPISWWEEVAFFRVGHPHNVHDGNAEVQKALITNDGNRIIIHSLFNPMAFTNDKKEVYIYDQKGNLIKSLSNNDIFDGNQESVRDLSIDENNNQLIIGSATKKNIRVELK